MLFLKGISEISLVSISGSTSEVGRPLSSLTAAMYSPLSVFTRLRSSTATPCPLANPTAFSLGLPSGPRHTDTGGPIFSTVSGRWLSDTPSTISTSLRGVPRVVTAPASMRYVSRSSLQSPSIAVSAGPTNPAGISSVPISNSSSFVTIGSVNKQVDESGDSAVDRGRVSILPFRSCTPPRSRP